MKKKKRVWIVLAVLAVIVVAAVVIIGRIKAGAAKALESMGAMTCTVERGTILSTATATGQLSAAETVNVELPDGLKINDISVAVGDEVKTGDPLCTLDPAIVYAQLIYEARQMTAADNRVSGKGTNDSIVAPCNARVKYVSVADGDDVLTAMERFGALAILSTDGYMRIDLEDAAGLVPGDRVTVSWTDDSYVTENETLTWTAGSAKGTVDRLIYDGAGCSILLSDAHAPYLGRATVQKDGKDIGQGNLVINKPASVYGYAGTVDKVSCHLDESVSNGKKLFTLKEYPATTAFDLRYNERVVVADLYERLIALYGDPVLTAPCDGVVSGVSVSETERSGKTDKADKKSIAFTIDVGGAGKLTVDVDELDIVSVSVGQTAEASFDAVPGESFPATVERVARIGKKQNSISVYPVELTIEADERLLSGMNGTATIQAGKAENVLVIPIDAISEDAEGSFVTVAGGDGTTQQRYIKTGLSDGTMTEVTEGLSEGETLSYELPGMTMADMMMAGTASVSVSSSEG